MLTDDAVGFWSQRRALVGRVREEGQLGLALLHVPDGTQRKVAQDGGTTIK